MGEIAIYKKLKDALPYICYINICILWGTSNLATKIGVGKLPTTVFSCIRYLTTALAAFIISFFIRGRLPKAFKEWRVLLTTAFLMNFLTNGCTVLGNKYADSGLVTVIFSAVPIFITIIDSLILKNYSMGKKGWLGLFGGLFGISFMALFKNSRLKSDIRGIIFALCASLFWSIGSVYSKERRVESPAVTQIFIEAFFSGSLFFVTGSITGDFKLEGVGIPELIPALYLAIADSLIGFMSYICLLKIWKPALVSTYAYINPVVALILGFLVLKEPLTIGKTAGMCIIIISVILIKKDKAANGKIT